MSVFVHRQVFFHIRKNKLFDMDIKKATNGFGGVRHFKCFIIIFFIVSLLKAQTDELEFTHYTSEDGLSLSNITSVLQDSRGFLWIGTYNGLNRFDGYEFKTFLPQSNSANKISNHSILSLYEDSKGCIWVGTLDGLNRFDWKTEEFFVYRNNLQDPHSLSNNNVLSIHEDKSGNLWIGTLNGLNKYNREKNNFTVFKKVSDRLNPDSLNSVVAMADDENGILWMGTWNGLTCMDNNGVVVKQYFSQNPNAKNFDFRIVLSIKKDSKNNIWIGTNGNGLKKFDPRTGKFTNYISVAGEANSISNNYVTSIFEDSKNNIWIGTRDGFNKFDFRTNKFKRYLRDSQKPMSIKSNEIHSITEDNSGIIWVGTAASLSRFYVPKNKFNLYSENFENPSKGIISNRVTALCLDKYENIWVGSFKGLNYINTKNGLVKKFFNQQGNPNSLSDNNIMSLLEDQSGKIWIGTFHSGVNIYDPASGNFKTFTYDINDDKSISNNGVTSIFKDSKGNIWLGTWWGLNRFDNKTQKFFRYFHDQNNPNSIPHDLIWTIFEDSKGMMWFGTDGGGVSEYNPNTNHFTNFNRDSSALHISENRVFVIFESKDGHIWFGTNNGLNEYDRTTGKITIYTDANGLPGNLINSIREDNKGFIWIASDKGLSKLDRRKNSFTNYSKRNGLNELDFIQNSSAKAKDGTLYFGCRSGLMYFHPDSIKDESVSAPLVFTDFKIFNQSVPISKDGSTVLTESITGKKILHIPYKASVITLEFALLDYYNVKRNRFSYKLVGFDTEWNDVGSRNSATYTNLPPGEYNFIVRATNNVVQNKGSEASIKIIIEPAFYQTWIFRIAVAAFVLGVTFLTMHMRTKKIKKQNKDLEIKVAERTKDLDQTINELSQEIITRKIAEERLQKSLEEKEILLKEIHHRVKNNLQVISSLLFLQSVSLKDDEAVNLFKDSQDRIRCMALIHEKLYQSKDLAGISFNEYVKSLVDDLERSYKKQSVPVVTKLNIGDIKLSLDTAMSCGLMVNEMMTNSFKYAFPNEWVKQKPDDYEFGIWISVEKLGPKKYILEFRDNGIGIPEELDIMNTESLGMKLINSLIIQLNGSMEINRNNGTHFKIEFEDLG